MKVTITSAAPSTQGLRLGLRLEHEKAGWIRFATTVLVVKDLTYAERAYLTEQLNAFSYELDEEDEPLFSDDSFI